MNRMVKKFMVVLLSAFMVLGAVTTPVQAKGDSYPTSIFDWFRLWQQPQPEEPTEPAPEETTAETEKPSEEAVETEQPAEEAKEETAEEPAAPETTEETVQEPAENPETEVLYPEFAETKTVGDKTVKIAVPEGALPEGTTVEVTEPNLEEVQATVNDAEGINGTVLVAVDITFYDVNGEKIEPKEQSEVKVYISAPEIVEAENVEIVHLPDEAEPKTIEQIEQDETAEDEVAFASDQFSIYAIIEGEPTPEQDTPYRATYEFYNADGSKYYFKDASGRDQFTQILKDGEKLEDVGIPTKGASQNAKFIGWFDEDGTKVEVGETKTVTKNETIKLTAKLQALVNVFFVTAVMEDDQGQAIARSIVTVKQVEYEVGQAEPITVVVSDITTDAPTAEQAVVGWNRNETAANAGTTEGTDGVITLYPNGSGEITDVMLFPAVKNAYWLYFNENDGGTGGGASYTQPEFVMVGGKPTEPADPHRTGYEFGGWFKDPECTQLFSFDEPLSATTTVYAKWNGAATTYTVILWVQRTADSANLPNDGQNRPEAERTYDFYKAFSVNSTTGGTATVANQYKQYADSGQPLYNDGHIEYDRCDADKTVAADGSTVMNVYYDRDVMTIHFKYGQYDSTDTYATWYGLYDATFGESGKTWPAINNIKWRSANYTYTFLDSFKSFDSNADDEMTLWQVQASDSYYHYYFQKETLTAGTYNTANQSERSGRLTLSNKYTGFTLYQYKDGDYDSWHNALNGQRIENANRDLYIRYSRNSYDLEYHNGARGTEGTVLTTHSVKYEQPLADHANPADPTYPVAADADLYNFIGWFADSSWSTLVTFTELSDQEKQNYTDWYGVSSFVVIDKMPAHNIPLYAGYSLKGWDCALDPNGGEFTSPTQAGVFWLQYGEPFSSDIKVNIKREGYVFQGWMLAEVPLDDDGNLDIDVVTRNSLRFVGDDSNWTMTDEPWQFDTGITGPTALIAKWFYKTAMNVVYDANGGTNPPKDEGAYSDGATTVAFCAPIAPANKVFLGWDIDGTDEVEKLMPGDSFEVSSDYAVDGTVTLKAVYHEFNKDEEVPVSYINWYRNWTAEDTVEEGRLHQDADLQINKGVEIYTINDGIPTRKGYKFLGWARMPEFENNESTTAPKTYYGDADLYLTWVEATDTVPAHYECEGKTVTEVAADEEEHYQAFYAVWEKQFFYVYHSSDNTIEKIALDDTRVNNTGEFNMVAAVKGDNLYGGYYHKYNKASADYLNGGGKAHPEIAKDEDGKPYVGGAGYWTKKYAYTDNGEAMKPVADETYYLKEVPNGFLKPYLHLIYDERSKDPVNQIKHMYLITDIDDGNYNNMGLLSKDEFGNRIKFSGSFIIANYAQTKKETITAKAKFSVAGGYVAVWQPDNLIQIDKDYDYIPWWTTPDGVTVEGNTKRTVHMRNCAVKVNLDLKDSSGNEIYFVDGPKN